ncbi:hypothetical protein [Nocardiopsis sp. Huas11]|uniref:hypothetical protein n=1 Tax=Nocardiopsis sp. Huas11 TaxID=2183912 RepID=UPI0011C496B8|nr:hypothetical protein [Nocardiopsis sp. Huas11]
MDDSHRPICWHVRTVEPGTASVWPYVDRLHFAVDTARGLVATDVKGGKLRAECGAGLHLLSVESVHEYLTRNQR